MFEEIVTYLEMALKKALIRVVMGGGVYNYLYYHFCDNIPSFPPEQPPFPR